MEDWHWQLHTERERVRERSTASEAGITPVTEIRCADLPVAGRQVTNSAGADRAGSHPGEVTDARG